MSDISKTNLNHAPVTTQSVQKQESSNKKNMLVGTGAGLLAGGTIGGFARKNAEIKDSDIIELMKNNDDVKKYVDPHNQAIQNILKEMDEEVKKVDAIAGKLASEKAVDDADKAFLKAIGLDEKVTVDKLKEVSAKKHDKLEILKNEPNKLANKRASAAVGLTKVEVHQSNIEKGYDLVKKSLAKEVKNKDELKKQYTEFANTVLGKKIEDADFEKAQRAFFKEMGLDKAKLDEKNVEQEFVKAYKTHLANDKVSLEKLDDLKTVELLKKSLGEKAKSLTELKDKKVKELLESFKPLYEGFDKDVEKAAKKIKVDDASLLTLEKFKTLKEGAVKALKSGKFKKGIAIGALAGAVVGSVAALLVPKIKKEN